MEPVETIQRRGCDGSHWGVSDWYPDLEAGIVAALAKGPAHRWTTGWYGSKKEIASACVRQAGGVITAEVSVSDDLDTEGCGSVTLKFTKRLDKIRDAVNRACDLAEAQRKDNAVYRGFAVYTRCSGYASYAGSKGMGRKHYYQGWVETYILPVGAGHLYKEPPGDNYHCWGWQGDYEIPPRTKARFEKWLAEWDGEAELKVGKFTIKPWQD